MKNIFVLIFLCLHLGTFAQEQILECFGSRNDTANIPPTKHLNWSIIVDNAIPNISYGNECYGHIVEFSQFVLEYNDTTRVAINIHIELGYISLLLSDYEFIMQQKQENLKNIYLYFGYRENCKGEKRRYYEIPIEYISQLDTTINSYTAIYIYNTDKKENKKYYIPLPDKTYNYQLVCNGCGVRPIQKKFTKKQKDCWGN
jgi:hypothetical protein